MQERQDIKNILGLFVVKCIKFVLSRFPVLLLPWHIFENLNFVYYLVIKYLI